MVRLPRRSACVDAAVSAADKPSPVLVVTQLDDPTADLVIGELTERDVPIIRLDTADFPHTVSLSTHIGQDVGITGRVRTMSREVDVSRVRSLYYRRPTQFDFEHLEGQDARFARAQARYGFGGALANLPGCLYVNHPTAIADAEVKPAQLAAAADVGLTVPPTLITNEPDEARAFAAKHAPIVYKPLRATRYQAENEPCTVWTREIAVDDLTDAVAGTAHLFQATVDKVADLRITVIGDRVFCVRIDTRDPALLDWRYDYDQLSYTTTEPPSGVTGRLHAYLRRFGLVFGCFDFALTAAGEAVFLECNPNGQWAWLQQPTGLPMAQAFADLLHHATPRKSGRGLAQCCGRRVSRA